MSDKIFINGIDVSNCSSFCKYNTFAMCNPENWCLAYDINCNRIWCNHKEFYSMIAKNKRGIINE